MYMMRELRKGSTRRPTVRRKPNQQRRKKGARSRYRWNSIYTRCTAIWTTLYSVFVFFPEICFVLIMYCTLSHMLGHANDKLYTIKINKDFLMRHLKRGSL